MFYNTFKCYRNIKKLINIRPFNFSLLGFLLDFVFNLLLYNDIRCVSIKGFIPFLVVN